MRVARALVGLALAYFVSLTAAGAQEAAHKPPTALAIPSQFERHGVTIEDPYSWLRDKTGSRVRNHLILRYLHAENAYFEIWEKAHAGLIETLFREFRDRQTEDDATLPVKDGDYLVWSRFDKGAQYRTFLRRRVGGGAEEVVLDAGKLAASRAHFDLRGPAYSRDGRLAAYAFDVDGGEHYTLVIRDIATGRDIERVPNVAGEAVWTSDSRALAYAQVGRLEQADRIRLHRLGTDPSLDPTLFVESDPGFSVSVSLSRDRSHLIIDTGDHVTSEVRLVPAGDPTGEPIVVMPRRAGHDYSVDVAEGRLYILTNDTHRNFRLVTADLASPGTWVEAIAGSDSHYLRDIRIFPGYIAVLERVGGLDQVRIRHSDGAEHYVALPGTSYTVGFDGSPDYDVPLLRLDYSSLVTPETVFEYDVGTRRLTTLKVQQVPAGYDASKYEALRLFAKARDGKDIPISLVMPKGYLRNGTGKLHLTAYGAYGNAQTPTFSTEWLSLLDRGFAVAIAHVRGGDELGPQWYLDGKLDKRWNAFNDFVDVARALAARGYAKEGNIAISGASAGGELIAVATNVAPELWRAVVAEVPFVDVLNTMLDASIPLTAEEWAEWGNPVTDKAAFDLIRSYSPYDNVGRHAYPRMMVTAGLNDQRVSYWEPAKWVARLRASKTDDNLILLHTDLDGGHGGKTGRFEALRAAAERYAFMISAFDER